MSGFYPSFKRSYSHEELVEHFLLTPADVQLVLSCRGDTDRCGMALLLKALGYLGYVPDSLEQTVRKMAGLDSVIPWARQPVWSICS